jgi:hypothetical protein
MAIPNPEPGLVISHSYVWHREHQAGQIEGRKTRPCVIVLAVTREGENTASVVVLPITHSPPDDPASAVEIPAVVNSHLGLDAGRSWIIVAEGNEFLWPGYDLHKLPQSDRYEYGFLPPRLFNQVRDAFVAHYRAGPRRVISRS